jgi:hypothetical protein
LSGAGEHENGDSNEGKYDKRDNGWYEVRGAFLRQLLLDDLVVLDVHL